MPYGPWDGSAIWEWGRGFGGGCGGGDMVGICYLVVMSWISITEQGCEKLRGFVRRGV